jgi:AraC-like DNA-binding protein
MALFLTRPSVWPRLLVLAVAVHSSAADRSCLRFIGPRQATPLSSGICTVAVEACDRARAVELTARYWVPGEDKPRSRVIGNITRPPYKLVWTNEGVPNQLYDGMSLTAETTLRQRERDTARLEGIFLTHAPVRRPDRKAPYRTKSGAQRSGTPIVLAAAPRPGKAEVWTFWNGKYLVFHVNVRDPFFYSGLPDRELNKLGAEIMIDPRLARKPFPSKEVMVFVVPLEVEPYRVVHEPVRGKDGSFSIAKSTRKVPYPCRVRTEDFKGYIIELAVPWSAMGGEMPREVGVNVTVHLLDQASKAHKVSWAEATGDAVYSPFTWGTVRMQDKPILASPWILWLVSFAGGIAAGLVLVLLYRLLSGIGPLSRFERNEKEQDLLHEVMNTIESNITDANLSRERIAQQLSISPRQVNRVLQRHHGEGFRECLMRSRVEIVKERLRSSHSSEAAIAASCGFSSVDQMEKYFKRFSHTTPYRFREEHQVT